MTNFKMSAKLTSLIKQREELLKKQDEKTANISALNDAQQVLLAQKSKELQEVINQYAAEPSAKLEAHLTDLEKEVAQLQAKVAGAQNRSSLVFQTDSTEAQSLKQQINAQAQAEYLAHYNAKKEELYTKIGEAKTAYLNGLADLYNLRVSTNIGYSSLTDNPALVGLHEPDFFHITGSYRPLGITNKEVQDALKEGEAKDKWDRPYINELE